MPIEKSGFETGISLKQEDGVSAQDFIFGSGAPIGTSGDTATAPKSSRYGDIASGQQYTKYADTNSAADWAADVSNIEGKFFVAHFFGSGTAKNLWLSSFASQQASDETTIVLPFDLKLLSLTFGNKKDSADSKIRITKNTIDEDDYEAEWTVEGFKFAWKSDFAASNITFDTGDRMRVYAKEDGTIDPEQLNIMLIFQITSSILGSGGVSSGD